ncbi:MAG: signal peptidase II [Alphaproteobacteria bacterium]
MSPKPAEPSAALPLGLAVAALVATLDQIVKWWIGAILADSTGLIKITSFFNLATVWNRGVSFGLLGGAPPSPWFLAGFAGLVVAGLVVWLARLSERWLAVSVGFIIGGAVGNIIDRIWHGAVFDFLDFHLAGYHWPAFNVSDAAITTGIAGLLIDSLLIRRERHKN